MAYELCPECRTNKVPPRRYVCQECEERLVAAELEPGPAPKWWAFLKKPRKSDPEIVPEEDPVPVPLSYRIVRVVRGTMMTGLVGCVTLYAWNYCRHPIRIADRTSMRAPKFVQHIQERSTTIEQELTDALRQ